VTGWLVPSTSQKIPYSLASTFHCRRAPFLKTGFFAGKGAENTTEKSRQCFTGREFT